MNIKKILPALTSLSLVMGLSACVMDTPTISDGPSNEETTTTPETQGVGKFGQVFSWETADLTVSKPKPYEPTNMAAGADDFPDTVSVDVKLTNTGDELLDPTLVMVTASSGEHEASQVFDANSDTGPTTSIKPGKSVNWTVIFNVASAKDVTVEVSPPEPFTMEPALFSTGG